MKVSRRWLEAFLGRALPVRDLAERLATLGAPVDDIEPLHAGLGEVVIGLVEEVTPHPNADRLRLCVVNDGSPERLRVVCGASNVTVGRKYPFARVGATLPGGLRLERRKIRGEVSEGMLCSARELGLGEDQEGILELDLPDAPGASFAEAWQLVDDRLELDVGPNRPDLLGHKGVARELAASYDVPFRLPTLPGPTVDLPGIARVAAAGTTGGVRVAIEVGAGCGRFLGAVIRGVKVGPSPAWLQRRLEAIGVRSISNVVDATNYVMHELGQPLHAYDLATLQGPAVSARAAQAGERLVTLDGVERSLEAGMTVIADQGRVIGVAGVMGGSATEVSTSTTDVFLECAWFEPARVRATRRALGLSTEASYRFERGVDRWNGPEALRRCLEVILGSAGGGIEGEPVDCWPEPGNPLRVFLRCGRVSQVLGVELQLHAIERALVAVGATVVAKPEDDRLAVQVPGWRPDLREEIDLIEEVARQYGYDRIPSDLRPFRMGLRGDAPIELAADRLRDGLAAQGLLEAATMPLGPLAEGAVALANPVSADFACLRRSVLPGLVREVERNWAERVRDIRLFEIGTVFAPVTPGRPVETTRVAVVVSGGREPGHWTASGHSPSFDLWDLKGLLETVRDLANPAATVQVEGPGWTLRAPDGALVGEARQLTADAPKWAAPVFGLEVDVAAGSLASTGYRRLPTTPAVERDLALVVPHAVTAAVVLEAVRRPAGDQLEGVRVVDEYRGSGVPEGARSVAIRLTFRAMDRTLRDAEVDAAVGRVTGALEKDLGVVLRSS
jgi:phenylalanyl-tRNA synthetase beta chain